MYLMPQKKAYLCPITVCLGYLVLSISSPNEWVALVELFRNYYLFFPFFSIFTNLILSEHFFFSTQILTHLLALNQDKLLFAYDGLHGSYLLVCLLFFFSINKIYCLFEIYYARNVSVCFLVQIKIWTDLWAHSLVVGGGGVYVFVWMMNEYYYKKMETIRFLFSMFVFLSFTFSSHFSFQQMPNMGNIRKFSSEIKTSCSFCCQLFLVSFSPFFVACIHTHFHSYFHLDECRIFSYSNTLFRWMVLMEHLLNIIFHCEFFRKLGPLFFSHQLTLCSRCHSLPPFVLLLFKWCLYGNVFFLSP